MIFFSVVSCFISLKISLCSGEIRSPRSGDERCPPLTIHVCKNGLDVFIVFQLIDKGVDLF